MSYRLLCETTMDATPEQVWDVWGDLASYPTWDPREEVNQPGGPLAPGMVGEFKQAGRGAGTYTITAVDPGHSWTSESPLPGGTLAIDHVVTAAAGGAHLAKTYRVSGPMSVAFRLFFAAGIRREMPATYAALEGEVARRTAARS